MAVLTNNVKKGTFYTLGQNGYEKLCPYANEVYMQDGTTVEDKVSGLSFEYGKSGNWYYRKWNNGTLECWLEGNYSLGNTPINNSAWGGYVSDYITLPNYPIAFSLPPATSIHSCKMDDSAAGDYMIIWAGLSTTRSKELLQRPPQFKYWRGTSHTFGHPAVTCYAIGHWK